METDQQKTKNKNQCLSSLPFFKDSVLKIYFCIHFMNLLLHFGWTMWFEIFLMNLILSFEIVFLKQMIEAIILSIFQNFLQSLGVVDKFPWLMLQEMIFLLSLTVFLSMDA